MPFAHCDEQQTLTSTRRFQAGLTCQGAFGALCKTGVIVYISYCQQITLKGSVIS